jgi:hypothetical protein
VDAGGLESGHLLARGPLAARNDRPGCPTASNVRVPERETTPTEPGLWIRAGMMPLFTLADGRMTPEQFGSISPCYSSTTARITG